MSFRAFLGGELGQSMPEYALLLSIVTALLIGACSALGVTAGHLYSAVTNAMP